MYIGMAEWVSDIKAVSEEYANAITDQEFESNSIMRTSAQVTNSGVKSSLESLSDEVRSMALPETRFEIHNELIGDEIYTTVKEKEARLQAMSEFFNH